MRGTRGGGGQRRGREPEPGGGADGDGRELSRLGHALARRGAAGRPVPARGRRRHAAAQRHARAFAPAFVQALAQLPGVARTGTLRTRPLLLDADAAGGDADRAQPRRPTPAQLAAAGRRRAAGAGGADRHLRERGDGRAVRRAAGHARSRRWRRRFAARRRDSRRSSSSPACGATTCGSSAPSPWMRATSSA